MSPEGRLVPIPPGWSFGGPVGGVGEGQSHTPSRPDGSADTALTMYKNAYAGFATSKIDHTKQTVKCKHEHVGTIK